MLVCSVLLLQSEAVRFLILCLQRITGEIIGSKGKSVAFGGCGKLPEMTFDTYELLLRACALAVMGNTVQDGCSSAVRYVTPDTDCRVWGGGQDERIW
jgi:hypothetical protein